MRCWRRLARWRRSCRGAGGKNVGARPLVALTAIVKNEASTIRALLDSCIGVVDHATILDTGSEDDTRAIASAFTAYPVRVYEGPFVDFASARNKVLALEETGPNPFHSRLDSVGPHATFALSLSGGETLHNGAALRAFLDEHRDTSHGAFSLRVRYGTASFFYPHVLRIGSPWRYESAVHEIPVNQDDRDEQPVIIPGGAFVEHTVDPPEKRRDRLLNRNLPGLLAALPDAKDDRARARLMIHVAQTYEALADLAPRDVPGGEYVSLMATAMGCYMRRVELGGGADEVNYARMKYLVCAGALRFYTDREIVDRAYDVARADCLERPETLYLIAVHTEKDRKKFALEYSCMAYRVSLEQRERPRTSMPVDHSILWRSCLIAARCASALGIDEEAHIHARNGVDAGGPREEFRAWL